MPDVASLADADVVGLEAYHPFLLNLPLVLILMAGVAVSMDIVVEELAIFPALSDAVMTTLWMPSFKVADVCHEPLFTETNAPAKPEVESEPVGVTMTWDRYQPFLPIEPLISRPIFGDSGS